MEASLAHKKAIAISFPFNGWGSWTEDDIQTAVQVRHACAHVIVLHVLMLCILMPPQVSCWHQKLPKTGKLRTVMRSAAGACRA